jgi:hypothetical protein
LDFDFDETDLLIPASATPGADKGTPILSAPDSVGAGLHINLIPDASVAGAPSWFVPSVQAAANILQQTFSDNITLNISYGWGTIGGDPITETNTALGGAFGFNIGYSTVKSWLAADAKSADDAAAIAALPDSTSAFPHNRSSFGISTAQEKALGHFTGNASALDGEIGFGTGWTQGAILGAALHELTHAMGRVSGWSLDLFRYSAPGTNLFTLGQPAYFSIDGGTTHLANFGQTSDTGDWLASGGNSTPFTRNDPFDEFINSSSNALTAVDITVMDVLGFDRVGSTTPHDDFASSLTDTTAPFAQVAVNGTGTGSLETIGDRDWFRVQLVAGVTYVINLEGAATAAGTLSDPYLRFHDGAGALLAQNDDASTSNLNSQLTFAAATTGTYYVEAGAFSDTGTGTYRVSVNTTTPGDHAPVITSDGGGDTAALIRAENSTVVTIVTATDPDAGTILTFSLIGGADAAKFHIDSTGALSFVTAPDFETPSDSDHNNSYIVVVQVSDNASPSLSDTQTITVNVTDINENTRIDAGLHGDFSGDHKADLLLFAVDGTVTIAQMNGAQVASNTNFGVVGHEWQIQSIADFDGSGGSDVLWEANDGSVASWLMNGTQITTSTSFGIVGHEWHILGTTDFGGDGKADVLWRADSGALAIWQMNGNHIVTSTSPGAIGNDWHVVALGDFGGDHKSDILWRSDSGAVSLWQMNGSQIASDTSLGAVAAQLHVVGAGDFNGDGKSDILWRADDGTFSLWQMNGATVQSNQTIGTIGNEWHVDGTGDFNGDGKADILLRDTSGSTILWTMDGAHILAQQSVAVPATSILGEHHYDFV